MKIVWSIVLILITFALGFWLFIADKNKSLKNEEIKKLDLSTDIKNVDNNRENKNIENIQEENNIISNEVENKKIMKAILYTNKGNITLEFNTNTPKTVENFIKLAKSGFYDGTKFHRVIKGFMNQGGDSLSKDDTKKDYWGTGGPGYKFDDEIDSNNKNNKYTISMANSGPNTNGSQFFINTAENNFLDTKHTVFGKVVNGFDVIDEINSVKTDSNDRPIEAIIIEKITLE